MSFALMKSGFESLSDRAAIAQHYGLSLRASDAGSALGGGPETPGYVYEELVDLSYSDGRRLATILASRLAAGADAESKLKTLKTLRHLTTKGSRSFRKSLRTRDEQLKLASELGSSVPTSARSAAEGKVVLRQVREVAGRLREDLFRQETMEADERREERVPPPRARLPGMGTTSRQHGGKYEGFGSAPAPATLGGRFMEALEEILTVNDERREVLEACLANPSSGDYVPVEMTISTTASSEEEIRKAQPPQPPPNKHVSRRAGGGWESSDEEEDASVDEIAQEADETLVDGDGSWKEIIDDFCRDGSGGSLQRVDRCFRRLCEERKQREVVLAISDKLTEEAEDATAVFKLLSLLEFFVRTPLVQSSFFRPAIEATLKRLEGSEDEKIAVKALKLSLITAFHATTS